MTTHRFEWRVFDGHMHLVIAKYATTVRTACGRMFGAHQERRDNGERTCLACTRAGRTAA